MPLRVEVGLGPGDIVLDGDPAPSTERGAVASNFWPVSIAAKRWPISATAELLFGSGEGKKLRGNRFTQICLESGR